VLTLPPLLQATHPVPAAAVTALAGAVVAARGAGVAGTALATASTLAGQLSVGWSNDYLDREEDAAVGRRDKPIPAGRIRPRAVWRAALVAFPVCLGLSVPLGVPEVAVMAAAVGAAWAYNLGLKRTFLSWLPYVVSFGLAPVYIWLASQDRLPPGWVVAGAALLGLAGHLTNVLPDIEADRARGARGLPHRLGPRPSLALAAVALGATVGLVLGFADRIGPATLFGGVVAVTLTVALLVAGAVRRTRLAFLLTIAAAATTVGTFLLSAAD
jgi:4-hydroxybenzoate polyprenyltransferase